MDKRGVVVGGLLAAVAAHAALDPKIEREVAGVFSNACGDRSHVMVRLYGDTLDVERAGRTVHAQRVQVLRAPPGGEPVPDFKVGVRGQVAGQREPVTLTLTHNAKGLFAHIDGSAAALAPLGPGIVGSTVRHCDPNRNALPGQQPSQAGAGPTMLLRDPQFRARYLQALGPRAREPWIAGLSGPAPTNQSVQVAGQPYTFAAACKPHDCDQHHLGLLYSATRQVVYVVVHDGGRDTVYGAPPPAVALALARLTRQAWRP